MLGLETASQPQHPLTLFPCPNLPHLLTPDVALALEDMAAEARLVKRCLLRAVKGCKAEAEERERLVVERYLVSPDRKRMLAEVGALGWGVEWVAVARPSLQVFFGAFGGTVDL